MLQKIVALLILMREAISSCETSASNQDTWCYIQKKRYLHLISLTCIPIKIHSERMWLVSHALAKLQTMCLGL
jgi:hypothetical protein